MPISTSTNPPELLTIRDWLRYAVTGMNAGKLSFGHGSDNALDEAAFLILETLHLPVDDINPWLDCRLTADEKIKLAALISARIETRKPAAYLTNSAYIQGHRFYVDERVIVPRSFIGELLLSDALSAFLPEPQTVSRILDLCTGSGCLAILAAGQFPDATVDAVDISSDALHVAQRNVDDYGLQDTIRLVQSNLFEGLAGQRYDLIISNPPYVTAAAVENFPAEFRAEPQIAHFGGEDGMDLVRQILTSAQKHLKPNGLLVVELGQGRDALEATHPDRPFIWLDTEASEGEVFAISAADLKAMGSEAIKPRSPRTTSKG